MRSDVGIVQWVLPSIDRDFRDACLATLHEDIRERTLVLDNSSCNRGVARSWNLGLDRAVSVRARWLVILSESIRFGVHGGADFEENLAGSMTSATCDQTCTIDYNTGAGFCHTGYGWHLIGISADTFIQVGRFDEIFWPAWWEDADFTRRRILAGVGKATHVNGVDAHLVACEHSIATGLVGHTWAHTAGAYEAKWGGINGTEKWEHPYGNERLDWTFTGPGR